MRVIWLRFIKGFYWRQNSNADREASKNKSSHQRIKQPRILFLLAHLTVNDDMLTT